MEILSLKELACAIIIVVELFDRIMQNDAGKELWRLMNWGSGLLLEDLQI